MAELTKSTLLTALNEWGEYVPRFNRLTPDEKADFLKTQGYASLKDLLAHISVWWEEAEGIVRDTLENREHPRRAYRNFDTFNAESVARFKNTPEAEFMDWYESMRQKMITQVSSLTDEQMKNRRISTWLNGTVLSHIKEHNLYASRFVITDTLEREWAGYISRFNAMSEERQKAFLDKQGFPRFRDLAAHIIAWWEDGIRIITGIRDNPSFKWREHDTDAFNAEAIKKFGKLDESEVWEKFESTRQSLVELVAHLPEETLNHKDVQGWLQADVLEHFYEHAL